MSQPTIKSDDKDKGAKPFEKKVKVPMKLSAVHAPAEMPLHEDSFQLKEPVVVAITNGENHTQIVVHRPVGESGLSEDKWVISPVSEIKALLSNAEDPSREKKDVAVQALRLQYAIDKGHYVKDADGTLRFPPGVMRGETISSIRAKAKQLHEEAKRLERTKYEASCAERGVKPKNDWKFGKVVDSFLPEEFKTLEKALNIKFKDDQKEKIAKITGQPFRTLCGPNSDQPQVALETGGREYTSNQMVDAIKRTLMTSAGGQARFDANAREAFSAFKNAGDDVGKLKEFIFQFAYPGFRPKTGGTTGSTAT